MTFGVRSSTVLRDTKGKLPGQLSAWALSVGRGISTGPWKMGPQRRDRQDWGLYHSLAYCCSWSQENSPIGIKVLQLILDDPDSPQNGPPYFFRITEGNTGSVFRVTPDGWLVTAGSLSRRTQEWYQLHIEVSAVWIQAGVCGDGG